MSKTDIKGGSALHSAAQSGHAGIAKELVEVGGKELVLIKVNSGRSALRFAAQQGHEATVLLLIETGGEDLVFGVSDTDGNTVLHYAAGKGHVEVVWLLIWAGGQRLLFLTNKDGVMPLHLAASDRSTCRGSR